MSDSIQNSKNVLNKVNIHDITGDITIGDTEIHIHEYANKKVKKLLTHPPFIPEVFLGRDDDLRSIHQQFFEGENLLLLVTGEGGMGKTSIAAKYFQIYQNDYQHLAWVFVQSTILDALLTLTIPLQLTFDPKMPNEQRLPLLLQEMANLNKPCLLVLDNANQLPELEKHYKALRSCPNFHLLLTTRITQFEQAARHEVKPLAKNQRIELFQKYYPKLQTSEHDLLFSISKAVGNNTLVLELLAKNLRQFNRYKTHYRLSDLWQDLQEKGLLGVRGKSVQTAYQSGQELRKETPEAIISAMYELNDLSAAERQLLSIFAVLPAENIALEVLEEVLAAIENLEHTLELLEQKGWLEYNEDSSTFKVSPVVQEITIAKNEDLLADVQVLLDALKAKLDYTASINHFEDYEAAAFFARLAKNMVNSLKGKNNDVGLLYERLGAFQTATGNLEQALTYFEQFNQLEKELHEAHPQHVEFKNSLAISYQFLGKTQSDLGNLEQALAYFGQYNQLEKELHETHSQNVEFKNGLAISYQHLGDTQSTLGNLEQALIEFEQFNQLEKELHEAHPQHVEFKNSLAISYQFLGKTQSDLGNLEQALAYFGQYNQLEKELHETHPQHVEFKNGLAISYQFLGKTQSDLGNLEQALPYFEQYNQLEKELHEAHPQHVEFKNLLAISYQYLGDTKSALGNLEQALIEFEQFNQLEKELHEAHPQHVEFKNGLAISYAYLGEHYQKLEDLEQAHFYFREAKGLWVALVADFPAYVEFQQRLRWVEGKLR